MKKVTTRELNEKKHFNKYAKKYDQNYTYSNPFTKYKILKKFSDLNKALDKITADKNIKVLDIGCGTGEYTKLIADKYKKFKVIGLDISPEIIKIAKQKCKKYKNTTFLAKSIYSSGFANNSFDVVTGFYILHHLDLDKVVKEVYRILKPGGLAFFCEPNILNPAVYLIKSNKYLKLKVGDSPDEWAINPISIINNFDKFKVVKVTTSEFVWPFKFVPTGLMILIDKITGLINKIPLLKYLGGSVQVAAYK